MPSDAAIRAAARRHGLNPQEANDLKAFATGVMTAAGLPHLALPVAALRTLMCDQCDGLGVEPDTGEECQWCA
jgi:hypothetical protein